MLFGVIYLCIFNILVKFTIAIISYNNVSHYKIITLGKDEFKKHVNGEFVIYLLFKV